MNHSLSTVCKGGRHLRYVHEGGVAPPPPPWAYCSEDASPGACTHGPLPFYPGQSSSESLCTQNTRESWEEAGPGSAGLGQGLRFPKTMPPGHIDAAGGGHT